jgi:lipoprotein-releasing system permease protein
MNWRFVFYIAKRYFFSSKEEKFISLMSFLSIITIALGVFTLIVIMAFMDAMKKEIVNSIISSNGEIILHIQSPKKSDQILNKVSQFNFVKEAYKELDLKALCVSPSDGFFICLAGINSNMIKKNFNCDIEKIKHEFDDGNKNETAPAFISYSCAKRFNLHIGDMLNLIDNYCNPTKGTNQGRKFKIVSISNNKKGSLSEGADKIFTLDCVLEKQFAFLNHTIQIITQNPEKVCEYSKIILNNLDNFNFNLHTWQDNNENLLNALNIEKNCMFLILSLILVLSSFVMMSSLFMFVREKFSEICVFRTIGASKLNILCIFLLYGIFASISGISFGSSIAYIFLRYFDQIKSFLFHNQGFFIFHFLFTLFKDINIVITQSDFIFICLIAFLISLPATIYPSLKAASFNLSKGVKM